MRHVPRRQTQMLAPSPSAKNSFHESIGIRCLFFLWLLPSVFSQETAGVSEPSVCKAVFRTPLSEVGQSGVCVSGDRLFLMVHKKLEGPLEGGFFLTVTSLGSALINTPASCFGKLGCQEALPEKFWNRGMTRQA